ncbi:DNA-binding transcriptional regulator, ArsR family [Hathewaya proteolytica DSM 3090]|uniref:DNA-binding transcriptional regulator, ArsR family n=1 Tax=Hathewaya proteolytica DSM 3090 TaxID=1121331 RepID=A0A1M6K510_9CLOT|nr:metalloregulator ArsR/SmtB family transcription factor [Hathewaya proteolytica]SHJ53940.1 DNA-binding transcriptional regulator, ArsR family [Hathewaya proteolytica DSM 3090]
MKDKSAYEKAKFVSNLMKTLTNEYRLMILCMLEEGEKTVGEICSELQGIGMSAVSQHLSMLKSHDLIESSKVGQNVIYRISDKRISEVIKKIREEYC